VWYVGTWSGWLGGDVVVYEVVCGRGKYRTGGAGGGYRKGKDTQEAVKRSSDDLESTTRCIIDISYTQTALVKLLPTSTLCCPPFSCFEEGHIA
jgi:hypothetical protein